jgi:hypothetical protein
MQRAGLGAWRAVREIPNAPFGSRLTLPPINVSLYEIQIAK